MRRQKGFTLIELVVTMTVILLITGALLVMSRSGEAQAALIRSAQKLALDISRQQTNAMSSKEVGNGIPCGYGVHFQTGSGSYVLFADRGDEVDCSDQDFQPTGGETISTNKLETGIVISGFSRQNIVFNPPEPSVHFYPPGGQQAEIILYSPKIDKSATVIVTSAGRIYIQ